MSKALRTAREMLSRHPGVAFPVDMESIVAAEGCVLVTWPFLLPVKEVKRGRWIGLAEGLDVRERRYLIAHALAHHLLHCGNQLAFQGLWETYRRRQEREADRCAAHMLMPEAELARVAPAPHWELAECFGVPEELVHLRLTEFATAAEVARWRGLSPHLEEWHC